MKIEEIYNCRCTRKQTSSNYAEDKWEKNNNNKKQEIQSKRDEKY
jgi:hypothetical protein